MLKHKELTETRVNRASRRIFKVIYSQLTQLKASFLASDEPLAWNEIKGRRFKPIRVGDEWGNEFSCAWFKLNGRVPRSMAGQNVVALIDLDGEACLFDSRGNPVQGLTPHYDDRHGGLIGPKREIKLLNSARGNEAVNLLLDAGANHLWRSAGPARIKQMDLAVLNPLAWSVYHEFLFLEQLMKSLPDERHRQLILKALNEACNVLGDCDDASLNKARRLLAPELARPAKHSALSVSAIGHAHIDVAWLWPLRETVRKTARTFATALTLMKEYPDYKFGASQPQLYQMMKDHHPGLYRRIQQAVKDKRWEIQGGMWVESDTNIPSGESLVRQVLLGKRFYRAEFGIDVKNLWLPDVFGYSAALPQILKQSGIDYFTTHKLNWNQFNPFPHHTMTWQGLDGTRVFAHFMAGNDYNAPCTPESFMNYERQNKDNDRTRDALCLFGIGDGGGGPGPTHLEWLQLAADLEDLPRVVPEFASDFFEKAEQNSTDLLNWEGELYFEYHRGTYTSQALVKKRNRQLEILLREAELAWSMLPLTQYPARLLDKAWKTVLLNQFHDIIPGSSINRVYQEAHQQYADVERSLTESIEKADQAWVAGIELGDLCHPLVLRNSLSWDRHELVLLADHLPKKAGQWVTSTSETLLSQTVEEGTLVQVRVPALGQALIGQGSGQEPARGRLEATPRTLQNDLLKVVFAVDGRIRRIYDKIEKREILLPGSYANEFLLFEDRPLAYDAWDIDAFYMEPEPTRPALVKSQITENGPLRAGIRQTWRGQNYDLIQTISLTHDSRLITFDTQVNWREAHHMLRVSFPVNVRSDHASYDIQFGHINRPTHMNTSWDMARFEVVAHKWADISQPNYGVAIINDCKYGHQILGQTISLNLLRSAKSPDPEADMHEHRFRYGLLPHPGDLHQSEVIYKAHEFNVPLRVVRPGTKAQRRTRHAKWDRRFMQTSCQNVMIDTIKKAEDDRSLVIRCHEDFGIDCICEFQLPASILRIQEVNLLEEAQEDVWIEPANGKISLRFSPFEIKSFRCVDDQV